MDYDDPIDEFLKPEKLEDFHQAEQKAVPGQSKMRSAADDVIDALGGVKHRAKAKKACPSCKGTDFNVTRPLSGPAVSRCTQCGHKLFGASRSPAWMAEPVHGQGAGGAFYRSYESAPSPTETHAPKSRMKGRNYADLKDKE
jgi:ribosomal protein L37AE/L43A